jgi:phosphate:Na+ symporter
MRSVHAEYLIAAGGLGIFLIGMRTMTEGLRALAGAWLARALAAGTRSPARGAWFGALFTALIQSSGATTVAAVGFVGAGMLTFPQALGIVFGANLGSTATGWLVATLGFAVDLELVAHALALAGALLLVFGKGRMSAIGRALAGFALLFLGLEALKHAFAALPLLPSPADMPADTWGGRALLVAIGFALTLITQSSSVGVAAALTALNAGSLTLTQAAALVIGMDVGTSITALYASLGGSLGMRRTGLSNVVFNALSALPGYLLLPAFVGAVARVPGLQRPELVLVAFHSLYNLCGVVAAVALARPFARLIERCMPERAAASKRLDLDVANAPSVAIPACASALLRLVRRAAGATEDLLLAPPDSGVAANARIEPLRGDIESLRANLGEASTRDADGALHERHLALLHAADHLERWLDRLAEVPAAAARQDPLAREWARELAACAHEARSGALLPRLAPARELHAAFERRMPAVRTAALAGAARGERDPAHVLTALDELRRLEHVALHQQRVLHYLGAALAGSEPAS